MEFILSVYIIAEAGVNHNGKIELAKQLIDSAKHCGADCVKFQLFKAENLATLSAKQAPYQLQNNGNKISQLDMLRTLELSFDQITELKNYASHVDIDFMCSAFDEGSINFLGLSGLATFKIPSGEINNFFHLKMIAGFNKQVLLSTGMSNLNDIEAALSVLCNYGQDRSKITLLQCTSEYPAPHQDINLLAMGEMARHFNLNVGFSDHTKNLTAAIAAVALGATVIEKHFTLDRSMAGPDHIASLDQKGLLELVAKIRDTETLLGDARKFSTSSEQKNMESVRKSLVAKTAIKKGEEFSDKNLTAKRPGNGLSPMLFPSLKSKAAKKNFRPNEPIVL